jgi:hypothetical protein
MVQKIDMNGTQLTLATPDTHEAHWMDYNDYLRQLEAAWLRLSDDELPLNPRIWVSRGLERRRLLAPQPEVPVARSTSFNARWIRDPKIS